MLAGGGGGSGGGVLQPLSLLATLGLHGDEPVTDASIRAAYLKAARLHHPDKSRGDSSTAAAAVAAERFAAVQSAYEALTGEDPSAAEAGGGSGSGSGGEPRQEPEPGQRTSLDGVVAKARCHGKKLCFVSVRASPPSIAGTADDPSEHDAPQPVDMVFDGTHFDHADSPHAFPASKGDVAVGDAVVIEAQWVLIASRRRGGAPPEAALAVGEAAILLHPTLPSLGVLTGMERERQHNDSLADG